MNKNHLLIASLVAGALTATSAYSADQIEESKANLTEVASSEAAAILSSVQRDTVRFPNGAKAPEGCATVNYTITPENELTDIEVVEATDANFAMSAMRAVKKWDFSGVEGAPVDANTTAQTRFEFCTDVSEQECAAVKESACKGDDVIAAVSRSIDTNAIGTAGSDKVRERVAARRDYSGQIR